MREDRVPDDDDPPAAPLEGLLSRPFTRAAWGSLALFMRALPGGDDRTAALALLHARLEPWAAAARVGGDGLDGLWRLDRADLEHGALERPVNAGEPDVATIRGLERSSASVLWIEPAQLHFYFELHADGSYRELDLAAPQLDALDSAEDERIAAKLAATRPGLVRALPGHAATQPIDALGFSRARGRLGADAATLHFHAGDIVCQDKIWRKGQVIHREGYALEGGRRYTALRLWYRRLARFPGS